MSVSVTFNNGLGSSETVLGEPGMTLMEVAREAGVDGIIAECGGGATCSTCHVWVEPDWIAQVGKPPAQEDMLLEFAPGRTELSRLSCQITLTPELDGLSVTVPDEQAGY